MSMVERVARALCESCCGDCGDAPCSEWKVWEDQARAAIAAMREPTHLSDESDRELWRSMIDDALEPVDDDVDARVGGKSK